MRLQSARWGAAVAAALALVLATAGPAAAEGEIEVSSGGGYATTSNDVLFTDLASMVPLDEQATTFTVRNSGADAGFLRISISNVSATDPGFAEALTLRADIPGFSGQPVPLSTASPCRVLVEGFVLEPGATASVDAFLALGDLAGQDGQNESATFTVDIGLSDATPGSIAPTKCTPNSTTVPGTPDSPNPPNGGPGDPGNPGDNPDDPSAAPSASPTATPEPPAFQWPQFPTFDLDTNTVRLFQDWGALVPAFAFVLGAGWFLFIARRRRKKEEDEEEDDTDFDESFAV